VLNFENELMEGYFTNNDLVAEGAHNIWGERFQL
jgi:hypothetical protein